MLANRRARLQRRKDDIRIPRKEWEQLKKSPTFGELVELLEDKYDLESAKTVKGKDLTLIGYLSKRGIRDNH